MEAKLAGSDDLLKDLTEPQRQAVTHLDGPLLIIAAAGSGKTRVITRRVAWLIRQKITPASICAITFTNKAAGEMKQRVSKAVGREMRDFGRLDQFWPTICTFHSLCLRILRHYAPALGLPANFTVYDAADQNRTIKEALKLLEISSTNFSPASVHGVISRAKNQLIDARAFAERARDFHQKTVARVYAKYQQLLEKAQAMDFDDLLIRAVQALRDHPTILAELQDRFRYLLIDEYQDTNKAQYVLAHALALRHRNICVVGDPDQSIYAWRGADIRNILDFERDYPDAVVVKLEQNYRSTRTILHLAGSLISRNRQRKEKALWTENEQGEPARLLLCQDEHDEAAAVTQQLRELHTRHNFAWSDMAIFYRMNALSRVMEDALRRAKVPYQIARGVEFYGRKEIKDVLAYLRVVSNPSDDASLERIVNTPPRGISEGTIDRLREHALEQGGSLYDAMQRVEQVSGLTPRAALSIGKFVAMVEGWRALAAAPVDPDATSGRIKPLMERIYKESGYEKLLEKLDPDREEQIPNVNELISSAAEFDEGNPQGSLADYLAQISLVSDADHMEGAGGAVTLMTLHAAKGLEFPVVAMIGMEEGVLPHSRSREDPNQLEEERRLCFVGITRAQKRLILSKAQYRTIRGMRERTAASTFIAELPKESLHVEDRTDLSFGRDSHARRRRDDDSQHADCSFALGQQVRHRNFGIGTIVDLSNLGQHTRAVVQFSRFGRKTLILEYAQLESLD
jgi:DNA helicase-2/ATP-dependent DNA helicase PcrA